MYSRSTAIRQIIPYGVISLLWAVIQILDWLGWSAFPNKDLPERLTLYGVLALTVLFLQLSKSFLQITAKSWLGWPLGILWLGVFALFESGWTGAAGKIRLGGWVLYQNRLALTVLIVGWAFCMARIILLTVQSFLRAQHPYARNRSKLWFLPVLSTLAGDLAIFTWAVWLVGNPAGVETAWLDFPGATSPFVFFTREPGPETLSFALWIVGFGLRFIGVALSVSIVVSQIIPKARYNTPRILREYSLSISNILDTKLLATTAIGLIHDALEIRAGFLFMVEYDKTENVYYMRGAKGMGDTVPPPGLLSTSSPLIEYFVHKRLPLSQYALDHLSGFKTLAVEERSWLKSLGADVYIPIHAKEEWIGLLVLGPKVSGAPYGEDELEFLGILADQTAVALHNARLVESLTRLNNQYRRMYSALERANQHLERLDKTKSDFISIASHELRTPLSVIRGYSEILNDEAIVKANPYYAKMVSGIHAGILRLHEIVESMLDIASIDTRSLQLKTEQVALHVLIRMIIEGIKQGDFDRKLDLQVAEMRDLPPVYADPEALRKVFTHLILNAIKFTPDGGKVHISGKALPPEADSLPEGGVEILISDTGIGIAPDVQELIFTKFYQTGKLNLHSSGKTKFKGGGQGLGLAIAKGIVEAHGGRIWVESRGYDEETCPGSQFHVILPIRGT